MKFESTKDIEAPQDYVFRATSDFSAFERQALRRGVEVMRASGDGLVDVGTAWALKVNFRDRPWDINAKITAFDAPAGYVIRGVSDGVDIDLTVDLLALSRNTTRLTVSVALLPRTMATRFLIQSLKLISGRVQGKLDAWVSGFAVDTEDKYRAIG